MVFFAPYTDARTDHHHDHDGPADHAPPRTTTSTTTTTTVPPTSPTTTTTTSTSTTTTTTTSTTTIDQHHDSLPRLDDDVDSIDQSTAHDHDGARRLTHHGDRSGNRIVGRVP